MSYMVYRAKLFIRKLRGRIADRLRRISARVDPHGTLLTPEECRLLKQAKEIADDVRPWIELRAASEREHSPWMADFSNALDVPYDFDERYPYLGDDYGKHEPEDGK